MELVLQKTINDTLVDGYADNAEAWFTRTQIGELLEYDDPNRQVARIHNRHKERLDKYSAVVKLTTTDGKAYDTYVYDIRGVFEICRWSDQPKADEVMDKLYDMAEEVVRKGYYSALLPEQLINAIVSAADDKDRYPLVIEAMRSAKVDQSSFIADLTGMKPKDMSQKLFKISDENRHGRVTVMDWKRHHQGDFTAKDLYGKSHLKDYIIDVMVEACNRRRTDFRFYNFVKYCGEIHFTKNGYLAVLDEIDKMGYLSRNPDELKAWREEVLKMKL